MAQDIAIAGVSYSGVPSISIPKQTSGNASFYDISDTTAVASDVAVGKYFYTAAGVKTAGTATGVTIVSVKGSFTTSSTGSTAYTTTVPYTGSGYPVAFSLWVDGGISKSGATWTSRDIGQCSWVKVNDSTPDYTNDNSSNYFAGSAYYRSSTGWSQSNSTTLRLLRNSNAATNSTTVTVRIKNATTISYYVRKTDVNEYGLIPNKKYWYVITYSE